MMSESPWLGSETVSPRDDVRVLGVIFSSDLSLDKRVASVVYLSARVSTGFDRFDVFDGLWTSTL